MLASLRSSVSGFIAKALMGFLVLTFAVWGVGDMLRNSSGSWIMSVGGETVSYAEFATNRGYLERTLQAMGMSNIDRRMVENDLLRRTLEEKLITIRVKQLGLDISDELLAKRVKEAPLFRGEGGRFDPTAFERTLQQRGIGEHAFLEQLKADIRTGLLTTSVSLEDVTLPQGYIALLAANEAQTRDVVLIDVLPSSAANIPAADIRAYYDANKEVLFMAPERRSFTYVTFNASQIRSMVDKRITPEELRDRFEADKERFGTAGFQSAEATLRDELRAEYQDVVVSDLSMKIEDSLAAGDTIGDAVQKSGISAAPRSMNNVSTEYYDGETLEHAVATRGFALQEGETSSLEVAPDGSYYLVALESVIPATPRKLEEVEAEVRTRLAREQQGKAVRNRAAKIKSALQKTSDWQSVLAREGLQGRPVSNVSRPQRSRSAALPELLQQAVFEHGKGGIAGPLNRPDGGVTLALITAVHTPPPKADISVDKALREAMNQELLAQYFSYLAAHNKVEVNEPLLAQMRKQQAGE